MNTFEKWISDRILSHGSADGGFENWITDRLFPNILRDTNTESPPETPAYETPPNRFISDLVGTMRSFFRIKPSEDTSSPTEDPHKAGELTVNSLGNLYICKASGTPGTWVKVGTDIKSQITFTFAGDIEVTTGALRIYNRFGVDLTILEVFACVNTLPVLGGSGAGIECDVKINGTSIFDWEKLPPYITTSYTSYVTSFVTSTWEAGDYFTVDTNPIDNISNGSDLTVIIVVAQ